MMTEAVVTPWISDRDLALQNVRYVMNAAGNLHEDFHPSPDGFIATRAREVLGEAIGLLEDIKADPSVPGDAAAARRDRRRHLRPDEAPGRQGQGPRRRGREGGRLLQPGDRDPGGREQQR